MSTSDSIAEIIKIDNKEHLEVHIYEPDTFNLEVDSEPNEGDDDIYRFQDIKVYGTQNRSLEITELEDGNLLTCYKNEKFEPTNAPDTLNFIIDFSGYPKTSSDTAYVITNLEVYNGDRGSAEKWNSSKKIKELEIYYEHRFIGRAELYSTFKCQTVFLKGKDESLPIYLNKIDTITLLIKSTYNSDLSRKGYSLSDIHWGGIEVGVD